MNVILTLMSLIANNPCLGLWYPFGNLQSDGGDSSGSTNGKGASSEDQVGSGNPEQPLDLSAKSSSTSGMDQRNIFK